MKSIDKLREYVDKQRDEYNNHNVSFVWQLSTIADEIEAEIERDYMPKPKIEKNFNAINSGITDISEALQNIAECNAAKCAMRQEVTHADVETMIGSIAAIADAYYMRLPRDANNEPIHMGDTIEGELFFDNATVKGTVTTYHIHDNDEPDTVYIKVDCGNGTWTIKELRIKRCRHVKPRTLEDTLIEYRLKAYNLYADQELTGDERANEFMKLDAEYDSEIRELLGGDA